METKNSTAKTILKLAWPTMLEHLMQTIVQYVDIIMVGALGTQATAAVGATTTVNWLVFSCVSAISIGFLSYTSVNLVYLDSSAYIFILLLGVVHSWVHFILLRGSEPMRYTVQTY